MATKTKGDWDDMFENAGKVLLRLKMATEEADKPNASEAALQELDAAMEAWVEVEGLIDKIERLCKKEA